MQSITLFIDTNAFIQLRDLKDLPWRELFPGADSVTLMVARPVIGELGKHKVSTKGRQRDRARAALTLIDEASAAPDRSVVLKECPMKVTLAVARRLRPAWEELHELDPSDPDDQLVAAAVAYGRGAMLLSHDSGPRIGARDVGLTAYEPPESWLLAIEQTDEQKRIAQLTRALKDATESKPNLEIKVHGLDDHGRLKLHRPLLEPLSSTMAELLTARFLATRPKLRLTAQPEEFRNLTGMGLSYDDVQTYNRKYATFEAEVRQFLRNDP